MSRYDGLIIPRSYSEYINKTDAATLQQALQLSGVLSGTVAAGDNKAVTSEAVNNVLANYKKINSTVIKNNEKQIGISSNNTIISIVSNDENTAILLFVSPWKSGYTVLTGTLPSHLTITHSTYSYDVNIKSTHSNYEYYCSVF